jgi:hypothetical protein
MRTTGFSVLIFMAASLVGPLVRWVTWPPGTSSSTADFLYSLVLLLWPAQPVSVIEASTGTLIAIATSVGANVLLFGVLGALAGVLAGKGPALVVLYAGALALLVALTVWAFGLSFTYSAVLALIAAAALYALPFFAVFRLSHNVGHTT